MRIWSEDSAQSRSDQGTAVYYGYCNRSKRYRMMNLPDFVDSVQQGMNKWVSDAQNTYQNYARTYSTPARGHYQSGFHTDCDCHCDCCVCDSDLLVQARCGETRRIPVTFENDTRRDRDVTLELGKFLTSGGRDLQWQAALSETTFTLRACGEHTVIVTVGVRCGEQATGGDAAGKATGPGDPSTGQTGTVDRCEVAYGTLRADGCTVRPIVIAVAVLPDDCEAYHSPCGGCCCN